jgi:lipoprotein-releasing system permease protein
VPWYLYLALRQLFATRQRLFFTAISVLSVALGVMVLLVVLGVMGGFEVKIGEMTQDTQGDIQVRSEQIIADPGALQRVVAKVPGVVASTPFAAGFVMVMRDNFPAPAAIEGVDLDSVEQVVPLAKYIPAGSLSDLDDDSVILSSQLAVSLGATIGAKVQLFSPNMFQQMMNSSVATLPQELTVVGIFQIGHQQLDKATVIVTLREMQDLYALGAGVHGVNLKIAPQLDPDREAGQVNQAIAAAQKSGVLPRTPSMFGRSWKTQNQDFLWAVQLEKNMMTFILLIVVLVAAFLTMSLLLVLVFKKTREIGLLGALGATRAQVALCFCLQGVAIGILGTGVGLGAGFTLLRYRNEAIRALTFFTGSQDALESVYQFSQIPAHTSGSDLLTIVIAAIILSTLAGAVPALIAARLNPVEALRNE